MGNQFELQGEQVTVEPVYLRDRVDLRVDGEVIAASLEDLGEGEFVVEAAGMAFPMRIATWGDSVFIHCDGEVYEIAAVNALERAVEEARGGSASDGLIAPMPGVVVRVEKRAGDPVKRGETILTIESMKLQTAMKSPRDGVVQAILFEEAAGFDKGATLATLVPEGEEGEGR